MAETVILEKQVFSGFSTDEVVINSCLPLVVGETYKVVWDDTEYSCTGQDASFNEAGSVILGNAVMYGLEGGGEPFMLMTVPSSDVTAVVAMLADGSDFDMSVDTHTIAIYQNADEGEDNAGENHAPNDVVILNYSQTPVNYDAVPKVWLTHPDSTEEAPVLVPFTYGEAVSKTVEPDFSGGDMAVPIADGELVTAMTIAKPAGLLPENIAEGVDIAGIIGTLVAGGGGGVKLSFGQITTTGIVTVEHGLGEVPDLVVYGNGGWNAAYIGTNSRPLAFVVAMSSKLYEKLNTEGYAYYKQFGIAAAASSSANGALSIVSDIAIDSGASTYITADETSITIGWQSGSRTYGVSSKDNKYWIAIGGLT